MFVSKLVLTILAANAPSLLPYADASNVQQAVAMIAVEIRTMEETRLYCANEVPQAKRNFDYYTMLWESQNEEEIAAVEASLSRRPDRASFESMRDVAVTTGMAAIKSSAALLGAEKLCVATFMSIKSGDRNIAKKTPKASQFLKDYLREHPIPPEVSGKRDARIGCEIQYFNKGIDLDGARTACTCIADVMYKSALPDELTEIDKVARAQGDVSQLASFTRMAPDLATCAMGVLKPIEGSK